MNKILKLILVSSIFGNADYKDDLQLLEKNISCYDKFIEIQRKEDNKKHLTEFSKCVKKRIELKIDESYKDGVQIGVYQNKNKAESEVKLYNEWKQDNKFLGDSEAKLIFLKNNENIGGYEHLEKGKDFYFVVVYNIYMDLKILQKNIRKYKPNAKIFYKPKIFISNIRIEKNNQNETIKTLKKKLECIRRYETNDKELQRFMNCLKEITEEESIAGIQIFLTIDKNKAETEVAKYNKWKSSKSKELKKSEALWGEKYIKNELYYSVVVTTSSSFKTLKNKIEQYSKDYVDPFRVKKPKIVIQYNQE